MIDVLIFDLGGVLIRSGDRAGRRKWEIELGLADWELDEIVFNSAMGIKAQLGQNSDEELWLWVRDKIALSRSNFASLYQDFWSDNRVDQDMLELIFSLRSNYRTAVISNASVTLREDLRSRYGIFGAFDLVVCSAEEQVMKPDSEIFMRALSRLQVNPDRCLFIDDMEINVFAARGLGLATIHFTPVTDLKAELQKFGVKTRGES